MIIGPACATAIFGAEEDVAGRRVVRRGLDLHDRRLQIRTRPEALAGSGFGCGGVAAVSSSSRLRPPQPSASPRRRTRCTTSASARSANTYLMRDPPLASAPSNGRDGRGARTATQAASAGSAIAVSKPVFVHRQQRPQFLLRPVLRGVATTCTSVAPFQLAYNVSPSTAIAGLLCGRPTHGSDTHGTSPLPRARSASRAAVFPCGPNSVTNGWCPQPTR